MGGPPRFFQFLSLFLVSAAAGWLAPPAFASVEEFRQPNAFAVVIGISHYREEVIPKVPYAVKDAEAVVELLEKQGGVPRPNIKLLTDAKATVSDLRNHVGDWLRMRVKSDSTVYVYYAGHGTPDPRTGEAYLVPWEGHPDFPSGLYPLKELYDTLNRLPAPNIVVLLDSCFSGAAGRSVLAKGARPMGISVETPVLAGGKLTVLAAATGAQISSDYDKAGHGLFTNYLLTGLQGEADVNHDGLVTLSEVFPYVKEHVAHTAVEALNREQTPIVLPGEEALKTRSQIPLVHVVPGGETRRALSQKEQELKALEEQERRVEARRKLALIEQQIEEKKKQIEEKQKGIEVARAPAFQAGPEYPKNIVGKDGAPMALVPAGEFAMGSAADGPEHKVFLDTFYIDKFEVTTARYAEFLVATGRSVPFFWDEVKLESDGGRPVIGVDWNDADAYCKWAGKRLPTEAEWEKAARGTDQRTYPWGNDEPTSLLSNYSVDGKKAWQGMSTLSPVGSFEAGKSPYGIYDMAGNVWEWVADWYDASYYRFTPERNPPGPTKGPMKSIRGGGWLTPGNNMRMSRRNFDPPVNRFLYVGFRCVKPAAP